MGRKILIKDHLSREELVNHYHSCNDPVEKIHIQTIISLFDGKTATVLAEVTGYSKQWIGKLANRYNNDGIEGLKDKRHTNSGKKGKLTEEQKIQLKLSILGDAPDGGLWNSQKVANEISKIINEPVHQATGWRLLRSLGFTMQSVRPTHQFSATAEEKEEFKKKLLEKLEEIKKDNPNADIKAWAFDEHHIGLKPVFRKVWALEGQRPNRRDKS